MSGLRDPEDWNAEEHDEVLWYQLDLCQGLGTREDYPLADGWCELPHLDPDRAEEDRRAGRVLRTEWAERWRDFRIDAGPEAFRENLSAMALEVWAILEPEADSEDQP